jgi:hypothetical protein
MKLIVVERRDRILFYNWRLELNPASFLNIFRHHCNCENDRRLLVFGWGKVAANTRDSVVERNFSALIFSWN